MKRESKVTEGWDCMRGPCPVPGCGGFGSVGDHHGVRGEEWLYWVTADDGLTSLSLEVFTDIYPPTVPKSSLDLGRYGADLTLHVGFKTQKDQFRDAGGRDQCMFLSNKWGDCSRTTALGAREFFKQHGDPSGPNQSEAFWKALENEFLRMDTAARAERVDEKFCRCNACDGTGVVAK